MSETLNGKKVTKATVKAFIKKKFASGDLYVKVKSRFDGMTDCVEYVEGAKYELAEKDFYHENNMGIRGVWFTDSWNIIKLVEEGDLVGFEVYNSCGTFIVLSDSY